MTQGSYENAKNMYSALLEALETSRRLSLSPTDAAAHVEQAISSELGGFVVYLPKELIKCRKLP